jgi:hypothetical protein
LISIVIYVIISDQHSLPFFAGTASARELGIPLSLSGESCIPLSGDCQIFPYFLVFVMKPFWDMRGERSVRLKRIVELFDEGCLGQFLLAVALVVGSQLLSVTLKF